MESKLNTLYPALLNLQKELKSISRNAENPFFKSSYADLEHISNYLLPLLAKHGITLVNENFIENETLFLRASLKTLENEISSVWPIGKISDKQQSLGSANTYARRYLLQSLVGLAIGEEDDDAEKAMARPVAKTQNTRAPVQKLSGPSVDQIKRLYAIAASNGWPGAYSKAFVETNYGKSAKDLNRKEYNDICKHFELTSFTNAQKEQFQEYVEPN